MKENVIVFPSKFREDSKLSPEELSVKVKLLEEGMLAGVTKVYYADDYVPYSREKHLETVLKQLIHQHFSERELWWNYVMPNEYPLYEADKELWMQIYELIPEVVNAK